MRNGPVRLAGLVLAAAAALAGCGTTTTAPAAQVAGAAAAGDSAPATAAGSPSPAAAEGPSASARMICAPEAQEKITQALGLTLRRSVAPLWTAPVYRCTYPFTAGSLALSVREFVDASATTAYFTTARAAERSTELQGLGDAAFTTTDGSVYVRKDFKVLKVDVSRLPAAVGTASISRADAAFVVAQLIMGCWTGQ